MGRWRRLPGKGYEREGAQAVADWLRSRGVDSLVACIHPEHHASMGLARAIGLKMAGPASHGEMRWSSYGSG